MTAPISNEPTTTRLHHYAGRYSGTTASTRTRPHETADTTASADPNRMRPQAPPPQRRHSRSKPLRPLPELARARMKPQAPLSTPARKDTKPTTSCRLTSFPFTARFLSTGLSSQGPVSTGFVFLLLRPAHLGRPFTEQPHTHDLTVMPPCCPNSSHPFVPPS